MKGMKNMKIRKTPFRSSPFMLFMSFMVQSCVPARPAVVRHMDGEDFSTMKGMKFMKESSLHKSLGSICIPDSYTISAAKSAGRSPFPRARLLWTN